MGLQLSTSFSEQDGSIDQVNSSEEIKDVPKRDDSPETNGIQSSLISHSTNLLTSYSKEDPSLKDCPQSKNLNKEINQTSQINERVLLPGWVDLRERFNLPPVYTQGQCGDCTANAWAGLFAIEQVIQTNISFEPSRLFIYFNERILVEKPVTDNGADLCEGLLSLTIQGVCPEQDWPYHLSKVDQIPSEECYEQAINHRIVNGQELEQDLDQIKTCLNNNHPFVFAFEVYSNFHESDFKHGVMLLPTPGDTIIGRHAIVGVGYDDLLQAVLCRNSWGSDWGIDGYFWMPYAYINHPKYCRNFYYVEAITL